MARPSKTELKTTDYIDITLSARSQRGQQRGLEHRVAREPVLFDFCVLFFFCHQTTLLPRQSAHHLVLPLTALTGAVTVTELHATSLRSEAAEELSGWLPLRPQLSGGCPLTHR